MNFIVETTDVADMEIEHIVFGLIGRSPDYVERWRKELEEALVSLEFMPRKCPLAPENDHFPQEIRQLRFNKYRILFTILDSDGDGKDDLVRILHVRHGAQQWLHLEE